MAEPSNCHAVSDGPEVIRLLLVLSPGDPVRPGVFVVINSWKELVSLASKETVETWPCALTWVCERRS